MESMTSDMHSVPSGDGNTRSRACENCHKRKIRCDRSSPCSNCQNAKLTCRALVGKSTDQRQRIHVSSQYEKKLNHIEEQLSIIQETLQNLTTDSPKSSQSSVTVCPSTSFNPTANSRLASPSEPITSVPRVRPAFEGDSSLSAHSEYANRLFEQAIYRSPSAEMSPEIARALSSIESVLNRHDQQSAFHESHFPFQRTRESESEKVELPLVDDVAALLRWARGPTPPSLLCFLPLITIADLAELCKRAYFDMEDCSAAEFIIVNACLLFLFSEFCATQRYNPAAEKYLKHILLCRNNLENALGSLSLFMAPTLDNTKALVLGSMHALDISLPTMAWTLTSTAARMCQSLGYHRSTSMKEDKQEAAETKKAIFWYVYIMDKTLSLRLGRSSTIQEFDLSLDKFESSPDSRFHAWNGVWALWIETATLHGWVYEQLYSARALTQSDQERSDIVKRLSSFTITAQQRSSEVNHQGNQEAAHHRAYLDFVTKANDVVYLSLLTLIYRAAPRDPSEPASPFSKDCIEAARAALEAHQFCTSKYREDDEYAWTIYLHWTLLSCPFIPFMVIFCHAVTFLSIDDISRLENFVASLQPTEHTSEAGRKMHRLCYMFHQVGRLYVEGRLDQHQTSDLSGGDPYQQVSGPCFNAFRSVPGFPQMNDWSNLNTTTAQLGSADELATRENDPVLFSPMELENWFSGNQYIFGLLESDLSGADYP